MSQNLSELDFVVLKRLAQKPVHGYVLAREISKQEPPYARFSQSSVYQRLQILADAHYLEKEIAPSPKNPDRIIFSLSPFGQSQLEDAEVGYQGRLEDQLRSVSRQYRKLVWLLRLCGA